MAAELSYDFSRLSKESDIIQIQYDCNIHKSDGEEAQVWTSDNEDGFYSDTRKCDAWNLEPEDISFCEKFSNIIKRVNADKWRMDLKGEFETPLQFLHYHEPGHHFDWHHDVMVDIDFNLVGLRKITMVYCLSKSSDYEGGEFNVINFDQNIHSVKMDRGDLMILPSAVMHKVSPLISGERKTLVGWYG